MNNMSKIGKPLIEFEGNTVKLNSATEMPMASSFLWNSKMVVQASCRGFATAQFLQPEPTKYAHTPNAEAKHFMLPEQPVFAHHPGRFFYVKDLQSGVLFSAPHEPVRAKADEFSFISEPDCMRWLVVNNGIKVELCLSLTTHLAAELWQLKVTNVGEQNRTLSLTPYFPVGYMSWMNLSGEYSQELQAVICRSVTGYQKYSDYFKHRDFKDLTYFLADQAPDSWEVRQSEFEGEGGLQAPSALERDQLSNSDALYEIPAATLQYKLALGKAQSREFKFVFGPARDDAEIAQVRAELLDKPGVFEKAIREFSASKSCSQSKLKVSTPDPQFDHFVNHWLARQVFYHGDVNRLTTDPQTRNYLQDYMGMSYLKPELARKAFLFAMAQQNSDGAMPDGILLCDEAELKYINQVPHMDHCVWLPICISAYIEETSDYAVLDEMLEFADSAEKASVKEHICRALRWLYDKRDHRGLSYIEQGDWNDPMNMVGYKGKGVSSWLTLATAFGSKLWAEILKQVGDTQAIAEFENINRQCNAAVNEHAWSGEWYGRGITDDDVLFGIDTDNEGKIFLNPQSWALLSGAADEVQKAKLVQAIADNLETPYGVELLAPSFTKMREDIGRLTQKHPGVAENGSVYNHAGAFYVYALYRINMADKAYEMIRRMIPGPNHEDLVRRGQIPTFIPNYYRGAYRQFERTAGRSSQLFNTGTVHWIYRSLIDGLFGLRGCAEGLRIEPKLPSSWQQASVIREFRGATFAVSFVRSESSDLEVRLNGKLLNEPLIREFQPGQRYDLSVKLSAA